MRGRFSIENNPVTLADKAQRRHHHILGFTSMQTSLNDQLNTKCLSKKTTIFCLTHLVVTARDGSVNQQFISF
jgi:hypothetical protein